MTDQPPNAVKKRRAGAEDVEIGRKIRALRLERGLSQSGLADGIGLTFQQVQKYEKGTNRVSAGRLHKIAELLNTPIMFFYGGMGPRTKKREAGDPDFSFMQTRDAVRIMRAYSEISSHRNTPLWSWRNYCATRSEGRASAAARGSRSRTRVSGLPYQSLKLAIGCLPRLSGRDWRGRPARLS